MSLNVKTPPIGISGIFEIRDPFYIRPNTVYRVEGHRTVTDMAMSGEDPYTLVYLPNGVLREDFLVDVKNPELVFVTLVDEEGDLFHIPNSYILSYPNTSVVPHSWIVAVCSLGMLPENYDLTRVKEAIAESVSDFIGVEPNIYMAQKPTRDTVTTEEAQQLEVIRNSAIANRTTSYATKIEMSNKIEFLENQVRDLLNIIEGLQQ